MGLRLGISLALCATLAAVSAVGVGVGMTDRGHAADALYGPQSPGSATAFLARTIRLLAANDYAAAWSRLDPMQQVLVTRDAYVRCESATPIPGRLARIDVLRVRREQIVVPGAGRPARPSIVATFRVAIARRSGEAPVVVRVTAHALYEEGRWTWMLPRERLALDRSGRCGASRAPRYSGYPPA